MIFAGYETRFTEKTSCSDFKVTSKEEEKKDQPKFLGDEGHPNVKMVKVY